MSRFQCNYSKNIHKGFVLHDDVMMLEAAGWLQELFTTSSKLVATGNTKSISSTILSIYTCEIDNKHVH